MTGREFQSDNLEGSWNSFRKNLEEEPRAEQNIRMWMQASRFQEEPPSLESVIEQVQYWRSEPGIVDAAYYAYVSERSTWQWMAPGWHLNAMTNPRRNVEN